MLTVVSVVITPTLSPGGHSVDKIREQIKNLQAI